MNVSSFLSARFFLALLAIWLGGFVSIPAGAKPAKTKIEDLTDTVLANRIMTKFALVVRGSDLASFLSSRGPFTLFAPTDSAFSKLPPGELETLLRPENQELLQRILLFHVVNGNRFSAKDLLTQKSLPSCEGHPLTIHTSHSGAQFVQKAKILHADVRCANGVIHQIDTVLIPPGLVLPPLTAPEPAAAVAPSAAIPAATNINETAPAPATLPAPQETNAAPASTNAMAPASPAP